MTPAEIRSWRLAHNLTQAQAAMLVGKPMQRWSEWETGARPMRESARLLIVALDRIAWLESEVARVSVPEPHRSNWLVEQIAAAACEVDSWPEHKRAAMRADVVRLSAPDHWYDRLMSQVDSDGTAAIIPAPGESRRVTVRRRTLDGNDVALTAANFPHAAGLVRGRWAPVYLSPILGSPERFIIAVAVVGADGFHVEEANALKRLECLYGRAAETAMFAADVALEGLRSVLAADGPSALKEGVLVFPGVSIGEVYEGEARTLRDLGRTWMSALSSLYRYTPEQKLDVLRHTCAANNRDTNQ